MRNRATVRPHAKLSADSNKNTTETIFGHIATRVNEEFGIPQESIGFIKLESRSEALNLADYTVDLQICIPVRTFKEYLAAIARLEHFCDALEFSLAELEFTHGMYRQPSKHTFSVTPVLLLAKSN